MKEEIWNELYLYLIRIEIGVFKNFKECARSPCNGNHFSSNTGVTGRILPTNTDFEHARVWSTYFRLRFLDHDRYTDIYISREISIEHPSVGLASLAQLVTP